MYYARLKNDIQVYLPWDKVVQNWFSDFWPIQNQNQNQMAGGEPEPEPNQNRGSVQLVLVLWTGSELNFSIPSSEAAIENIQACWSTKSEENKYKYPGKGSGFLQWR
ncbi:hypothetical protein BYT27DRAFT_7218444 [Phlegmacium glaucopus]|nr:hypothetical protein BYT27DRAFT_7218444 [Phlegmacium glaucopus]